MRELLDAKVTEGYTPKLDANIAAVEAGRLEADLVIRARRTRRRRPLN
jgi:hypothetical protein